MSTYRIEYSDGAREDFADLGDLISKASSVERANRYVRKLIDECETLSFAPYRGSKRQELRSNMRVIGYKHAVSIVFRVEEEFCLVVILGIAYKGRSLAYVIQRDE